MVRITHFRFLQRCFEIQQGFSFGRAEQAALRADTQGRHDFATAGPSSHGSQWIISLTRLLTLAKRFHGNRTRPPSCLFIRKGWTGHNRERTAWAMVGGREGGGGKCRLILWSAKLKADIQIFARARASPPLPSPPSTLSPSRA